MAAAALGQLSPAAAAAAAAAAYVSPCCCLLLSLSLPTVNMDYVLSVSRM